MTRWSTGEATIERLLANGELEQVTVNKAQADSLVAQARRHLAAARSIAADDPVGGYQLLYDAARKMLVAVLANQGLRPTSRGGHIAVADAAKAQLGDHLRWFDRMRRRRNELEYPQESVPEPDRAALEEESVRIAELIESVERLLDVMGPF